MYVICIIYVLENIYIIYIFWNVMKETTMNLELENLHPYVHVSMIVQWLELTCPIMLTVQSS